MKFQKLIPKYILTTIIQFQPTIITKLSLKIYKSGKLLFHLVLEKFRLSKSKMQKPGKYPKFRVSFWKKLSPHFSQTCKMTEEKSLSMPGFERRRFENCSAKVCQNQKTALSFEIHT